MKISFKKALLSVLCALTIPAAVYSNEARKEIKLEDIERNWDSPQEAYNKTCAQCHELTVANQYQINMAYPEDVVEVRAQMIFDIVRHGLNAMPPFRSTEIDDATLMELATELAKGNIKEYFK